MGSIFLNEQPGPEAYLKVCIAMLKIKDPCGILVETPMAPSHASCRHFAVKARGFCHLRHFFPCHTTASYFPLVPYYGLLLEINVGYARKNNYAMRRKNAEVRLGSGDNSWCGLSLEHQLADHGLFDPKLQEALLRRLDHVVESLVLGHFPDSGDHPSGGAHGIKERY
jgi:hypothetical protein